MVLSWGSWQYKFDDTRRVLRFITIITIIIIISIACLSLIITIYLSCIGLPVSVILWLRTHVCSLFVAAQSIKSGHIQYIHPPSYFHGIKLIPWGYSHIHDSPSHHRNALSASRAQQPAASPHARNHAKLKFVMRIFCSGEAKTAESSLKAFIHNLTFANLFPSSISATHPSIHPTANLINIYSPSNKAISKFNKYH